MKRLALYLIGGLLLGGIIHIAVVLLVPHFATRDAYGALARLGPDDVFHAVPAEGGDTPIAGLDPRMAYVACRFSLADRPLHIFAPMTEDFWSAAVFDDRGNNLYSLNDRTAGRRDLDLVVATPLQVLRLRENPQPALDNAIVVELPMTAGFVMLRAFVGDPTLEPPVSKALAEADCTAG
ncbi:DUF1254 domain-containing protein [Kaistia geumhonensis]|uniref:Membrane protein n=1 Tax=Kaistia geumhonensis TaxID=410839 RepID=A0ABU0M3R7_9HYPH|nr:DUF1254 domain-containing protein [Kaistia geumhonensis]MCX5479197.1 DUF1254 domain-containing protein [Kaistia geumhonensis]MDQ0515583.1 putative membrane protein [Kaistia geumhonensis]